MADFSFSSITDSLKSTGESIGNAIESAGKDNKFINSALNIVDPGNARLAIAGLLKGGTKNTAKNTTKPNIQFATGESDWRVRVSLADSASYFYKSNDPGIMKELSATNGVIFPYTPQVSVTHAARYGSQNLTHSNYTNYFYEGSEVQAITINGEFTVQDIPEGRYLLASIYFFRAATKMFFGTGNNVGNPPPMVFLNGYGSHYFPNVPCVVTNFQHTLPQDVDYLDIPLSGGTNLYESDGTASKTPQLSTRVPTMSTLSITLQPIYTRKSLYDNFSLEDFAAGKLISGRGGYI